MKSNNRCLFLSLRCVRMSFYVLNLDSLFCSWSVSEEPICRRRKNVDRRHLRHALLRCLWLWLILISQVPEVARVASVNTIINRLFAEMFKKKRGVVHIFKYTNDEQLVKNLQIEDISRRPHINCTSSGALVNLIPGTCWSAIHMTVPYFFSDNAFQISHLKDLSC